MNFEENYPLILLDLCIYCKMQSLSCWSRRRIVQVSIQSKKASTKGFPLSLQSISILFFWAYICNLWWTEVWSFWGPTWTLRMYNFPAMSYKYGGRLLESSLTDAELYLIRTISFGLRSNRKSRRMPGELPSSWWYCMIRKTCTSWTVLTQGNTSKWLLWLLDRPYDVLFRFWNTVPKTFLFYSHNSGRACRQVASVLVACLRLFFKPVSGLT